MAEVLEGEVIEEDAVRIPHELDGEKKLALIGLDAEQMVFVAHGLHLLVNALKREDAFTGASYSQSVNEFFHDMASIAEEVRAL